MIARFQRGSGVYTCESCGRKTRATNDDAARVRCCEHCYDMAGIENEISDNRNSEGPEWVAEREAAMNRLRDIIISKGGKL